MILSWVIFVMQSLIAFAIWITGRYNRKMYKAFRQEMCENAADIARLKIQTAEYNAMKYRLDILEGKHLRARNLGIGGLPQPRPKEKNGD